MERTLILVKPDAFARNLTGEIIARFERKGLRLVALEQMTMTREMAERHYAEHVGKPFFEELVAFITSGPLVAMALEGDQAVAAARQVIGATNPLEASPGSIRGDYAIEVGQNMVHGSDSPESGVRELGLFFPVSEMNRLDAGSWKPPADAMPLILASRSPQRRALLEQLGVEFEVVVPDGVEELEHGPPVEVAAENAYRKASGVAGEDGDAKAAVLGVDTIVALGTTIYGKPADVTEARATLSALSGRRHTVISGVCVIVGDRRRRSAVASTVVEFRAIDAELLDWYLESGEWRERAGGYAIQGRGAALVEAIAGDYTNVVGLPVPTLLELMPWILQR